jgi:hypothetical protein
MAEPTAQEKRACGWLDTGSTLDHDAQLRAELDRMWGHLGTESTYGWRTCQFVREGRVLLTQGELDSTCNNKAIHGEKYCGEHLPRIPSRIVWFLIGAAAMWGVTHLHLF